MGGLQRVGLGGVGLGIADRLGVGPEAAVKSITPEQITSGLSEASQSIFRPENTEQIAEAVTKKTLGMPGGADLSQLINQNPAANTGNPNTAAFKDAMGGELGKSLQQAIPQSKEWNLMTGLGMNLLGGGQTAGFLQRKFAAEKAAADPQMALKQLGSATGKAFTPSSPAMQTAADGIAGIGQGAMDQSVEQSFGSVGQGLYHLLSGNFDKFLNLFGQDQNGTQASTPAAPAAVGAPNQQFDRPRAGPAVAQPS